MEHQRQASALRDTSVPVRPGSHLFLPTHRSGRRLFSPFYGENPKARKHGVRFSKPRRLEAEHLGSPSAARGRSLRTPVLPQPCAPRGFSALGVPPSSSRARAPQVPVQKPYLRTVGDRARTPAFASPGTDRGIPAARGRRGRGGGGGCRRARAAGRRQARGDERRAPGEGAAPGDRLQPRRAPRPRPPRPRCPGQRRLPAPEPR